MITSPREIEILELITQGHTTKEIAARLYLSDHTVNTHKRNLLRKLGAKNVVHLVANAYRLGMLEHVEV
jgi:DNA-binding CsgD family transcriptional regulator